MLTLAILFLLHLQQETVAVHGELPGGGEPNKNYFLKSFHFWPEIVPVEQNSCGENNAIIGFL